MGGVTNVEVGRVTSWGREGVEVSFTSEEVNVKLGDLLYVELADRVVVLEVVSHRGGVPTHPASLAVSTLVESDILRSTSKVMSVITSPVFEVRRGSGRAIVTRPQSPPPLDSAVRLITRGDGVSDRIMRDLNEGITPSDSGVGIAWLRSGSAQYEELRKVRYFPEACLRLDLAKTIPKHVLLVGATGSGKTTSVMGMVLTWFLEGEGGLAWLVIDRHGEYSRAEFMDAVRTAARLNSGRLRNSANLSILRLEPNATRPGDPNTYVGGLKASSVNANDVLYSMELWETEHSELSESLTILQEFLRLSECPEEELSTGGREQCLPKNVVNLFFHGPDEPNVNTLALLALVVDNVIRYDHKEKSEGRISGKTFYDVFKEAGIYVNKLRAYRRKVLYALGLTTRIEKIEGWSGNTVVRVLDDSHSVIKLPAFMKEASKVAAFLGALVKAAGSTTSYRWRVAGGHAEYTTAEEGIDASSILLDLDKGGLMVLDVSKVPPHVADIIAMSILRNLFTARLMEGVEACVGKSVVSVVSEEAPLYLSPDRVKSPYNIFARIAREGRKFGIGLVAVAQLASMIDRQILANFNTIVALRTKNLQDISYLTSIGVPGEALISLGDREGFLYTPDLRVREPIPVYIPSYYDPEVKERLSRLLEERMNAETGVRRAASKLAERFGGVK
ncbi:MAG: DUF87 domain-containing protein [Zestosphaera sp.]